MLLGQYPWSKTLCEAQRPRCGTVIINAFLQKYAKNLISLSLLQDNHGQDTSSILKMHSSILPSCTAETVSVQTFQSCQLLLNYILSNALHKNISILKYWVSPTQVHTNHVCSQTRRTGKK